jgi:serine-aspartate repeat-containing protein C/D/E
LDWQRDDCLGRRQRERLSEHRREILRPIQCDADGDSNCYTHSDSYPHTNANLYANPDGYVHPYADTYSNSYSDSNTYSNSYSDSNSDSNSYSDSNSDSQLYSDTNSHGNGNA